VHEEVTHWLPSCQIPFVTCLASLATQASTSKPMPAPFTPASHPFPLNWLRSCPCPLAGTQVPAHASHTPACCPSPHEPTTIQPNPTSWRTPTCACPLVPCFPQRSLEFLGDAQRRLIESNNIGLHLQAMQQGSRQLPWQTDATKEDNMARHQLGVQTRAIRDGNTLRHQLCVHRCHQA